MIRCILAMALAVATFGSNAVAQSVPQRPLADVVSAKLKPVSGLTYAPVITWGGDVHTQLALLEGNFKKGGLDLKLVREDNFANQVQNCMDGKTPFLRGTLGMINTANESFVSAGTELVVIYQHTWSVGGDTIVVRPGINQIGDLKGKIVALQQYGPHVDYLAKLLADAGVSPKDLTLEWYTELYPLEGADPNKLNNGPFAFVKKPGISAVMAIIPDALGLANGDESSLLPKVDGATILTTTKTNSRVIADVYAVRKDWYDAHQGEVQAFVASLLQAEELLRDLRKNTSDARYQALLKSSAKLLLDSEAATGVVEALLADCEHVGYAGNVGFITGTLPNGEKTTRNLQSISDEIQSSFSEMGLIKKRTLLPTPKLDFAKLAGGLRYAGEIAKGPQFDAAAAQRLVEGEIDSWDSVGSLFSREISFGPNQSDFNESEYAGKFQELIQLAQTNGGALVVIEGHADPLGVLTAQWGGESEASLAAKRAHVKNLSLERARKVRISFLNYCAGQKIQVNESQFVAVGRGVEAPKHKFPENKDAFLRWRTSNPIEAKKQWDENRRVVFRVQQVEAELGNIMDIK